MPERSPTLVGTVLGERYRLDRPIASGGMAAVWEATDEVLGRQVAVKILHSHLAEDEQFVGRFRAEAVAAARLAHPRIVAIYDTVHDDDDVSAIVMELVRGTTLREHLDAVGIAPADQVVEVGSQVADALGAAHAADLIHRDIKPANILLCEDRRIMVTDFGIAKLADSADHTREGTMLGTAKYLAPEQVEGGAVSPASDIYALGVVLYEMLAGRPPYDADTDAATALARLSSAPPRLGAVNPDVPPELESVVARAMARQPGDRYERADDLRAALMAADLTGRGRADHTALEAQPDPTPPAGEPSFVESERRWLLPAALIVLVATALGLAGVLIGRTLGGGLLDGDDDTGTATGGATDNSEVTLIEAAAFDPFGGDGENDDQAGRVIDGEVDTAWSTEGYEQRDLGPKPGVGIAVTLDGLAVMTEIRVGSPTIGWSGEIYVATDPGAELESWGSPVARATDIDGDHVFALSGAEGTRILVWITDLGNEPPRTHAEIAEITVGRA